MLLLALVALWFTIAIVFNGEPVIDRWFSNLFFEAAACPDGSATAVCGSFPLALRQPWASLRDIFHYLPMAGAILLAVLLASDIATGRGWLSPRPFHATLALAAFALGPGVLVNLFLKEWWGRPRPVMTDLFGGGLPFVPAGQWSDACAANCSFVSGEAAAIFWLVCLIPLLPARWRWRVGPLVVAAAIFTALLRVAFGGHYLSDVVLGGLSALVAFAAVACLAQWLLHRRRAA